MYKYTEHYRNDEGNPRHKAKSIGKVAWEPGKMFPNENYYTLYQVAPLYANIDVWDYGYSYLVMKISRDIGLLKCLEYAFGA